MAADMAVWPRMMAISAEDGHGGRQLRWQTAALVHPDRRSKFGRAQRSTRANMAHSIVGRHEHAGKYDADVFGTNASQHVLMQRYTVGDRFVWIDTEGGSERRRLGDGGHRYDEDDHRRGNAAEAAKAKADGQGRRR